MQQPHDGPLTKLDYYLAIKYLLEQAKQQGIGAEVHEMVETLIFSENNKKWLNAQKEHELMTLA